MSDVLNLSQIRASCTPQVCFKTSSPQCPSLNNIYFQHTSVSKQSLGTTYFLRPRSSSVWPAQMPHVSTLTVPLRYVKRVGSSKAAIHVGSCKNIPAKVKSNILLIVPTATAPSSEKQMGIPGFPYPQPTHCEINLTAKTYNERNHRTYTLCKHLQSPRTCRAWNRESTSSLRRSLVESKFQILNIDSCAHSQNPTHFHN